MVNVLTDGHENKRRRNTLRRHLENAIDHLGERLETFERIEFPHLAEGDKDTAIHDICRVIDLLEVTRTKVIRHQVDAETLRQELEPAADDLWRVDLLSDDGIEYGRAFLAEACRFIVTIVRDMPEFTDDLLLENYAVTRKLYDRLESSIDSIVLPHFRNGTPSESSIFEAGYRSDIVHRYKDMEIFGIDLQVPELRRQPIDVAYITLMSSSSGIYRTPISRYEAQDTAPEIQQARVDRALGAVALQTKSHSKGNRILLTGQAGSGKTTLAQWLAVRLAQRSLPSTMHRWQNCLPVVVHLRDAFRAESRGFSLGKHLIGSMVDEGAVPGNWLVSQLSQGNVLLILDGFDELSERGRQEAFHWIEKHLRDHPRSHILVTSRPDGLHRRFFREHQFSHLELESMSPGDIRRCVTAWFDAAMTSAPDSKDELAAHRKRLLNDIERRAPLQELAETPLVCAMLCSFYAHHLSESAPQSRGVLYEQVISALIDRRDRNRGAIEGEGRRLYLKEKQAVLQALARHMTEHDFTTIPTAPAVLEPRRSSELLGVVDKSEPLVPRVSALTVVEEQFRSMPAITVSPADALDHLLQRSVVFREVVPGEAHFVHRTLQEFLAARDYASRNLVDSLLDQALAAPWKRIVAFAAGRLHRDSATRLIQGLLDRAKNQPTRRRELLLLMAECLSATESVDSDVLRSAAAMLREILPPATIVEAELIGRSGEDVLRWLGGHAHQGDAVVAACIRAAAVSGSPIGLDVIMGYRSRITSPRLKREIVRAWRYFDATEYAENVLADLALEDIVLPLTSRPRLEAIARIPKARKVRIDSEEGIKDFESFRDLPELQEFNCVRCAGLSTLSGLGGLHGLQKLNLSGAKGIDDVSELGSLTELQELYLSGWSTLTDATPLGRLANLRVLYLDGCERITNFDWLRNLRELRTLCLDNCSLTRLDFSGAVPHLRTLRLMTRQPVEDLAFLSEMPGLRQLTINLGPRSTPLPVTGLARLRSLSLAGVVTKGDLHTLGDLQGLHELHISGLQSTEGLQSLGSLRELKVLSITDCRQLTSVKDIAVTGLKVIDLSRTSIRYTDFAARMPHLEEVHLDGCTELFDIQDLAPLRSLRRLTLPPMEEEVVADLRLNSQSQHLEIVCDSFSVVGLASS